MSGAKSKSATRLEHERTRERLRLRLIGEGRHDLAAKLFQCGQPQTLQCLNCGEKHPGEKRCRLKWCPACAPLRSAERAARLRQAYKRMQWPMHVTLTMRNVPDWSREHIKDLLMAFRKLRERKLFRRVTGGVVGVEVTNKGEGWHPHLHALLDCEWLAYYTPPPPRNASAWQRQNHCQRAHAELSSIWGECIGQSDIDPMTWVRRAYDDGVVEEICKYAVKGSELLKCEGEIGPLIDQLCGSRLVVGFGSLFGRMKELDDEAREDRPAGCDCSDPFLMPESVVQHQIKTAFSRSEPKNRKKR